MTRSIMKRKPKSKISFASTRSSIPARQEGGRGSSGGECGGLQDIPKEYYEAARIDGAGPIQSFFQITLPLLRPTSFFVLLVSTVTAVCGSQTFDLIYIMTKGGPANSTSLAIYYIYQQAFQFNEYGYAAAWRRCSSSC